jgi:hypothetical protein
MNYCLKSNMNLADDPGTKQAVNRVSPPFPRAVPPLQKLRSEDYDGAEKVAARSGNRHKFAQSTLQPKNRKL